MVNEPLIEAEAKPQAQTKPGEVWLTPGRFAILLALLVVLTFPGVLIKGQSFIIRDFGLFSYPVALFHRQSFWRGELPLWNPFNFCGIPFLAQWNTMTLYPGSLIYLLLPMPWSLSFFCLVHLFWGGLGMYFLARAWTKHELAAGLAGIIFSFNGLMLNFLMWPSHAATFSWLPWVLWLVPEGWREGNRKMLWGILAASMQMLAGGPESIFFTWLILFALMCVDWVRSKRCRLFAPEGRLTIAQRFSVGNLVEGQASPGGTAEMAPAHSAVPPGLDAISPTNPTLKRWAIFGQSLRDRSSDDPTGATMPARTVGEDTKGASSPTLNRKPLLNSQRGAILLRFFAMALLVFLICAAQLLPFLVLLGHSERGAGYSSVSYDWSMPIWGWANFFLPMFRMHPGSQGVFFQSGQNWTSSYYAGIGTIFLAVLAIGRSKDSRARLLAILFLLGAVLALGNKGLLYKVLLIVLPAAGAVRYPVKFVILCLALAPLLAGLGLAAVMAQGKSLAKSERGARCPGPVALSYIVCAPGILLLLGGLLVLEWRAPLPGDAWPLIFKNGAARAGFLLVILWLLRAMASDGRKRIVYGGLLLTTFWLDLATHLPSQNPTVRPSVYSPGYAQAELKWPPERQLGKCRVMLSPGAEEVLRLNSLPGIEQDFMIKRLAILCDCNLLDGIPQIHGFFSLTPRSVATLSSLPYANMNRDFPALLDLMGVTKITAPGKILGWTARPTAMPLITAGQKPVFADENHALAAFFQTNTDFRSVVFVPLEARDRITARQPVSARVLSAEFGDKSLSFEIDAKATALVVISQTHYPAWRAYVDGQPRRIWRANYAFEALQVPPGKHHIILNYQDRPFLIGAILSALGLAVWLLGWLLAAAGRLRAPVNVVRSGFN